MLSTLLSLLLTNGVNIFVFNSNSDSQVWQHSRNTDDKCLQDIAVREKRSTAMKTASTHTPNLPRTQSEGL